MHARMDTFYQNIPDVCILLSLYCCKYLYTLIEAYQYDRHFLLNNQYYVNQYNSPQVDPFMEFTLIGNQRQYDVRNEYERPLPTRLNPIYPVQTEPYLTTPFLGQNYPDRVYSDTSDSLRWGRDEIIRPKKTDNGNSEKPWDIYWTPGVDAKTVQNAGQYNLRIQSTNDPRELNSDTSVQHALDSKKTLGNTNDVDPDGYYNYDAPNHVIMGNSAAPYFGLSTRNLLHNIVDLSNVG